MNNNLLQKTISDISTKAKSLAFAGRSNDAIAEYRKGLALLAPPVHSSEYAVMLFVGIGEIYYAQRDWDESLRYFGEAVRSEGGLGDPSIHFRLGQIRYEQGEIEKAKDELMRAYMGSGEIIFQGQDPKYFDLIKGHLRSRQPNH